MGGSEEEGGEFFVRRGYSAEQEKGRFLFIVSNGILHSVEHRVVTNPNVARTTIANFLAPPVDNIIQPAKELIDYELNPPKFGAIKYKEFVAIYQALNIEPERIMKHYILQGSVLLSACVHGGLVQEGETYFESMEREYGIKPEKERYACMVNLFGRASQLEKAEKLIRSMPFEPDVVVWGALLGACRVYSCQGLC